MSNDPSSFELQNKNYQQEIEILKKKLASSLEENKRCHKEFSERSEKLHKEFTLGRTFKRKLINRFILLVFRFNNLFKKKKIQLKIKMAQ